MMLPRNRILVIGSEGQIGVELTRTLRRIHGDSSVIAADIHMPSPALTEEGPYITLDVLDRRALGHVIDHFRVAEIYHLAATLSANGEKNPVAAWNLNMTGLLNVLDAANEYRVSKMFWPSSIAVFGPQAPKRNCPQQTIMEPSTVYGISKKAGEQWCSWYERKYRMDIRSLRYPGLISSSAPPGGGTTDYAVDMFHHAIHSQTFTCFLRKTTRLPMMYMDDAIRAAMELMVAPKEALRQTGGYNIAAMSFTPEELAGQIAKAFPKFSVNYAPDERQEIADSWPASIEDIAARLDWGWKPAFNLQRTTDVMIHQLAPRLFAESSR